MGTESDFKRGKDMKAEGREDRNGMKVDGREDRNGVKAEGREDRNGNMNAESKGGTESRSQTTGQAGASAKLSSEQRTRITTVIRDQHVAPVTNVNFSISVGTRVPRDVSFHPLPTEIVTIYPDWRGYEFILVRDQIVVVIPGRSRSWRFSTSNPDAPPAGRACCPPLFYRDPSVPDGHTFNPIGSGPISVTEAATTLAVG